MNNAYNSASRNTIGSNRFPVGTDLLNYVKATAGKSGKTPYVYAYGESTSSIISSAPASCQ